MLRVCVSASTISGEQLAHLIKYIFAMPLNIYINFTRICIYDNAWCVFVRLMVRCVFDGRMINDNIIVARASTSTIIQHICIYILPSARPRRCAAYSVKSCVFGMRIDRVITTNWRWPRDHRAILHDSAFSISVAHLFSPYTKFAKYTNICIHGIWRRSVCFCCAKPPSDGQPYILWWKTTSFQFSRLDLMRTQIL